MGRRYGLGSLLSSTKTKGLPYHDGIWSSYFGQKKLVTPSGRICKKRIKTTVNVIKVNTPIFLRNIYTIIAR